MSGRRKVLAWAALIVLGWATVYGLYSGFTDAIEAVSR